MIPLHYFLWVGAALFSLGVAIVLTKRNIIAVLMGLELMLNAAALNLVAFSQYDTKLLQGQTFTLFVIAIAAAESALVLAITLKIYQHFRTIQLDKVNQLSET